MDLNVAIVEDDARYRSGLETLLGTAKGFRLRGVYGSADRALGEARRMASTSEDPPWDLVLMDLELPGTSGIEATRQLKRLSPRTSVVVLTVFEEPETILEAICAGADGYLLKKTSAGDLLAELRSIARGGVPLTAGVARTVLDMMRRGESVFRREPSAPPAGAPTRLDLTPRELEVLQCLVKGKSYKQAADALGIGLETVRTHIKAVYAKLQVHSVAEAVTRAIRDRLV